MEASHCSHANMQCRAADTHQACPPPAPALTPLCPRHLFHGARPLTNTAPHGGTRPSVLIWGWHQKGTLGHHQLLSPAAPAAQGPDDGSTPGTCPPACDTHCQNPELFSSTLHWHGSACGVPGKAHLTTAHHLKTQSSAPAPAPASFLWHPFLQSRIPKSFALFVCLREFVISEVRKDKALPVANRMK